MRGTKEISEIRSSLPNVIDLYTGLVHSSVHAFSSEYLFSWSLHAVHTIVYKDDFHEGKKAPSLKYTEFPFQKYWYISARAENVKT